MTRLACQYAIIRFLPYAETGEFANVGVVLACPATGYVDAKLLPTNHTRRIAGFFEPLDKRVFREAMGYLRDEVHRIRVSMELGNGHANPGVVQQVFANLVRPREALLRFSDVRAVLAEDADAMLDKLFARFVERDFASKQYDDKLLVRGIRNMLSRANLGEHFKPAEIGNEDLHIQVPFVHLRDNRPVLAIKPLDLAKDEPNQVFEHGGHWVDRVRRLGKHKLLPSGMLFAINEPQTIGTNVRKAADEIIVELREAGVDVVVANDARAITEFAAAASVH